MSSLDELLCQLASTDLENNNLKNEEEENEQESLLESTLNKCQQLLILDNDNDNDNDSNDNVLENQKQLGKWNPIALKSKYSKQRITNLLSIVLVNRIRYQISNRKSDSDSDSDNTNKEETVQELVGKLCSILIKAKIGLLDKTLDSIQQAIHNHNDGAHDDTAATIETIQQAFQTNLQANPQYWNVALSIIAKINPSTSGSDTTTTTTTTADTLQSLFLKQAIQKQFASTNSISLAQYYIAAMHPAHMQQMLTIMALKLKASPETSFETINAIIAHGITTTDTSDNSHIARVISKFVSNDSGNGNVSNGMLSSVMKLLVHSKANMRLLASSFLAKLGSIRCNGDGDGGGDEDNESVTKIVMQVLHHALMKTKKASVQLTTAEHRLGVYTAMAEIANSLSSNTEGVDVDVGVANMALEAIASSMVKETGKAKECGIRALFQWIGLYKQSQSQHEASSNDKGYKLAMDYLLQPILDIKPGSNNHGTDFRFRWGNLFANVEYSVAEMVVKNSWKHANDNVGASAGAGDNASKVLIGLTSIVDASAKKHKNSMLVPQLDGLMALQMLLLLQGLDGLMLQSSGSAIRALQGGKESSFLYSAAMVDAFQSEMIVQRLLHRCIAQYTKLVAKARDGGSLAAECVSIVKFNRDGFSAAAYALGSCIAQKPASGDDGGDVVTSLKTVLTYALPMERAADAIAAATYSRANELSLNQDDSGDDVFSTIHSVGIRAAATQLVKLVTDAKHFTDVLVLSHFGTAWMCSQQEDEEDEEREELENVCSEMVSGIHIDVSESDVADRLVQSAACSKDGEEDTCIATSKAVHLSALSLITTLGKIAGTYDEELTDPDEEESKACIFAWKLCVQQLAGKIADHLNATLVEAEKLSVDDVGLYGSPEGQLYNTATGNGNKSEIKVYKKNLSEEEEWERQVKMELAEKKKKKEAVPSLSDEDKSKIEVQTVERNRIRHILDFNYSRGLLSVQALCLSDIEVGNSILPAISPPVTSAAISTAKALKLDSKQSESFSTLCKLAECVFEIDEENAEDVATALIMCQQKSAEAESKGQIIVVPFPAKCDEAQIVISEMDDYGDTLSGNSFAFLFPILRATLTGQRTTAGCEAALKVLECHTELISVNVTVAALRKDMGSAVLELLSHDRSIAFKDPAPTEALVEIYTTGKKPTAAELAPLLSEAGALGTKNCRIATMTTFASIVETHPKLVKTNPVVENRILVNCFAKDASIKSEACRAWRLASGANETDSELPAPSKIYAIALVPLLSHKDSDIANAAAAAFAFGIHMHPDLTDKSFNRLFNAYIDSYATVSAGGSAQAPPKVPVAAAAPSLAAKPKKKASKLDIGTFKMKPMKKKSGSTIASLTKTKGTKKKAKPSASSSFAPKKKERTLDQDSLMSQFAPADAVAQKAEEKDCDGKIAIRSGVLQVLDALTGSSSRVEIQVPTLKLLVGFLMAYGLADVNERVRSTASSALRDTVASDSAKNAMDFLLPLLEKTLKDGKADTSSLSDLPIEKVLDNTAATDHRKEGVVIALGSAAIHLRDAEDAEKINETFNMLINALSTPSESVQASVALCLSKLMKKGNMKSQTEALLEERIKECLHGQSLASRRGSAYGISAIVKGSGIATLKKFSVVKQLEEACTTGSASTKEGALFAIELLSDRLGLLFEPYVIVLLPALLKSFSDSSDHVRAAAKNSVGLVMSKLSGHGVKLLVPAVLAGLEEDDWRTKQASINMLGSMSHCAPKQLASCLPNIVPKVTEAFSDTHPKVKASAASSLEEISKVIRNPEISEISSTLLQALTDPSNGTVVALESLIETEFLHAIDAASLSLIVPVIHRGLRDRAATTKRYGALIAGNIVTMINDPKDFVPYLPILLPDLKAVLLDPIPDCRSIAAKALGSLTRSLGEATFPDLRPWLIDVLRGEGGTSVERSGAAQGLTELLCAGGTGLVNEVMKDEILPLIDHPKASTREGVLWVLTFLPSSLGQSFAPLIDASFPALISGLSDDHESVRDVAMRAGRVTIRSHGKAHVDKILPSLEAGLNNEDYRIRAASLNLLGDLLSTLAGIRVSKGDLDTQEDIRQAERAQAQIALVLGPATRKRVLSSLYLRRSDTAAVVRQAAVLVWKSVVSVTPRTLREVLDSLVEQIVNALASGHPDHTQVAGRCLGDIVSKLGDTVLPEIMPVLKDALYRGDTHTRLGACVGLTEVIGCSSKEQIIKYLDILVRVVDEALCDDEKEVRKMAASCFQNLYIVVGNRAFDEIVPQLLASMESGDDHNRARAINGITGILSIRSKELLPYLISRLVKSRPITSNQASALGSICTVTGGSIHVFFGTIIPALLSELSNLFDVELDEEEKSREESLRKCIRSLCSSVEEIGVNSLIGEVASKCGSDKEGTRKEGCWVMQVIIEERKDKADYYDQIPIIIRELLYRLNDDSKKVLIAANAALSALSKNVSAEELVNHIEFIRNLIASMVSDARRRKGGVGDGEFLLPGFNMPKGLEPFLPIYQRGILYGDASVREVSAAGLGELMNITSNKFLAGPFIIKVTGPLLRIVGDRNPPAVKIAIIKTLGLILLKGGPALRAFVPQFQTTFLKALSDPSRQVRVEAIKALALLMPLSTRLDPLIKELVSTSLGNGAVSSLDSAAGLVVVQTATLEALAIVIKYGGKKAKLPTSIPSALDAGRSMLFHEDDGIRAGAAKVIGAACELSDVSVTNEVASELLASGSSSVEDKHGKACLCHYLLASSAGKILSSNIVTDMAKIIKNYMADETSQVQEAACVAAGAFLGAVGEDSTDKYVSLLQLPIIKCMDPKGTMEVLKSMAKGLSVGVQLEPDLFERKSTLTILDAALKCAMTGQQRVQLAFNDFLWLALKVKDGDDGLNQYCDEAMFENSRKMKSLFEKVLVRIKAVDVDGMA